MHLSTAPGMFTRLGGSTGEFRKYPPLWFSAIGGAVVLAVFVTSIWVLLKMKPGSIET